VRSERAERAAKGEKDIACVRPGPKQKLSAPQARLLADRTPVPLPDWCYDVSNGDGAWWYTRFEACAIGSWTVDVIEVPSGELVGQIYYLQADLVYTKADLPNWGHQLAISMVDGWGLISGTTVSGDATCNGACTLPASDIDFPAQAVTLDTVPYGDALPTTTVSAAGATGTAKTTMYYQFNNPAWTNSTPLTGSTPPVETRCDNATPGVAAIGCVFKDYEPVNVVSLSGPYPNYARHIQDAQASGLPGAYPNGTPLTRLTDAALRQSNGDTACPQASSGGYPRPTGYSCDEYPFRSTWQGAFTSATPPNPGRTFDWCQISALPQGVTGPNGWSACMIPATENSNAGLLDLRVFYNDNRVIEQDPFFVWIVD
jgi:hypothetical protein